MGRSDGADAGRRRETTDAVAAGDATLEHLAATARELAAASDLDELLHRTVELADRHLDGSEGASLMLIRKHGRISTPAWSSELARDGDRAQYEAGEGPCLDALMPTPTIVIGDLETETRWPTFRTAAFALGVRSMCSLRLFLLEDTLGALNIYSRRPNTFDRRAQLLGEVFASHAAIALKAAISTAGLEAALGSRDLIGQAKGILMGREAVTSAMAFERLRARSQRDNVPLRDVAAEVVRTGETGAEAFGTPAG